LLFLGTGISGGEYGALHGPSIMPGGHEEGYALVKEIFEKAAAQVEDGPCCAYLGPRSAGHFVKMVHNGIEYAFMQAIAEAYDLLRKAYRLSSEAIGKIFEEFNQSEIASYLIEITAKIFKVSDPETRKPLVELILDQAEQKGTGKWTSQTAFDFGVPTPVINQSVIARTISSFKQERVQFASLWKNKEAAPINFDEQHKEKIKDALFVSMVVAFSEGLHLLKVASQEMQYGLSLPEVVRIWKGGCILRARMLNQMQQALQNGEGEILLFSPTFLNEIQRRTPKLREIVALSIEKEIPASVLSTSLAYLDSWKSENLPANLIQAQRDFFGAHTYQRVDKEGVFHTIWEE
jgi:6-phosphogluconate dehydrogenase